MKELRADVAALKGEKGEKPAVKSEVAETPNPRSTSTTRRKTTAK